MKKFYIIYAESIDCHKGLEKHEYTFSDLKTANEALVKFVEQTPNVMFYIMESICYGVGKVKSIITVMED